jgi:phosphatidate cytidylyltransferase
MTFAERAGFQEVFMKRVITALLLILLVIVNLILLDYNPVFFAVFNTLIIGLCIYETTKALKTLLPLSYCVLSVLLAVLLLPSYIFFDGLTGIFILISLLFVAAVLFLVFDKNIQLSALFAFSLVLIYPSLLLSFNYPLVYSSNALFLLVTVFGIGPMSDTFAFAIGKTLKGIKLCPDVSSNKTVSGAIGGLIGGIIGGIAIYYIFIAFFPYIRIPSLGIMVVVGFLGSFFTQAGDLAESALKRRLKLKDFGNLLPGHGGVLDRVDGIMFNSLFVFLFFSYIIPLV